LIVRSDIDRSLSILGLNSLGWSLGMVALVVVIATIVIVLFLERGVIYPLVRLSNRVNDITAKGDVTMRITKGSGRDEIGSMTKNINNILSTLDAAQKQLAQEQVKLNEVLEKTGVEEQRARTIMNSIPHYVLCVRQNGIIHHANAAFLNTFQYATSEVSGKLIVTSLFINTTWEALIALCDKRESQEYEMVGRFQKRIPVIVSVTPITLFVDNQSTQAHVVLARNISENKLLKNSIEAERFRLALMEKNIEFDQLWSDSRRRQAFISYCTRMMSEENVKFLEAVEEYRSVMKQQHRVELQKQIITQFLIKDKSPYELNISAKTVKDLSQIEKGFGQIDLFDGLEEIIRGQVVLDTFARFLETEAEDESNTDTDFSVGSVELRDSLTLTALRDRSSSVHATDDSDVQSSADAN
jgi:PAS domain S-box-containing protein